MATAVTWCKLIALVLGNLGLAGFLAYELLQFLWHAITRTKSSAEQLHDPYDLSAAPTIAEELCARGYTLLQPGLVSKAALPNMARALQAAAKRGTAAGFQLREGCYVDAAGMREQSNCFLPYAAPYDQEIIRRVASSVVPQAMNLLWPGANVSLAYLHALLLPPSCRHMEMRFKLWNPMQIILRFFPEGQVTGHGETAIFAECKADMVSEDARNITQHLIKDGKLNSCWVASQSKSSLCHECMGKATDACVAASTVIGPLPPGAALLYNSAVLQAGLPCGAGAGQRVWEMAFAAAVPGIYNDDSEDMLGDVFAAWPREAEANRKADWDELKPTKHHLADSAEL